MFILLFCITFFGNFLNTECSNKQYERKWTSFRNPDCPIEICNGTAVNVIYYKGQASEDSLHFIISGGNYTETLSVLLIRSLDKTSHVTVDWENLVNRENQTDVITLNGTVDGSYGLIFTNLYEYVDKNDNVKMDDATVEKLNFDRFQWNFQTIPKKTGEISIFLKSSNLRLLAPSERNFSNIFNSSGFIGFKFNLSTAVLSSYRPNLKFMGNNTLVDTIFKDLNPQNIKSRFALQVALVNKVNVKEMKIVETRSIDDMESPSIFRIENLYGQPKDYSWQNSTYLQWKPVCYTKENERNLNTVCSVHKKLTQSLVSDNNGGSSSNEAVIRKSLVYLWFGDSMLDPNNSMQLLNLTFGNPADQFYNKTHFRIWTTSFGFGTPAVMETSLSIILVIAFGLGLPFVLIVVGSVYMFIKRTLRFGGDSSSGSSFSNPSQPQYDSIN